MATTNQTKDLAGMTPQAIASGDSLLAMRGGSVTPVTQASFKAKSAEGADGLRINETAPFSGKAVSELKAKLLAFAQAHPEGAAFKAVTPASLLTHFSNDSYTASGDLQFFTYALVTNYSTLGDFFCFWAQGYSAGSPLYQIYYSKNNGWAVYKLQGTQV